MSLHFEDIVLVVHMSRNTWPVCSMYWVDTVDRCGYGSLEKALFMILVEHITHFEAHWSQFSPNSILCLRLAQVPRSQNIIFFCIHNDDNNNDNDITNYFIQSPSSINMTISLELHWNIAQNLNCPSLSFLGTLSTRNYGQRASILGSIRT